MQWKKIKEINTPELASISKLAESDDIKSKALAYSIMENLPKLNIKNYTNEITINFLTKLKDAFEDIVYVGINPTTGKYTLWAIDFNHYRYNSEANNIYTNKHFNNKEVEVIETILDLYVAKNEYLKNKLSQGVYKFSKKRYTWLKLIK